MFGRLIEREERSENVWQTDREGRERMCGRLMKHEGREKMFGRLIEREERECVVD